MIKACSKLMSIGFEQLDLERIYARFELIIKNLKMLWNA